MYGHQFWQSADEQVKFLNAELKKEDYQILEYLTDDLRVDEGDLREDLAEHGWFYIAELNRFVKIDEQQAS